MKNKLLIIGASGHGNVVADIAFKMNRWNKIHFLDDNKTRSSIEIIVLDKSTNAHLYLDDYDIFVAIGNNSERRLIQEKLSSLGANLPVLIHPKAIIGEQVNIGCGTVIMPGVIINSCTKIGNGCIINTGATIDHDNFIGDFSHVSPGVHLAGGVNIGSEVWLGIGSIVINNVEIVARSKVGAGAVVIKDIIEPGTYVGVPATKIEG